MSISLDPAVDPTAFNQPDRPTLVEADVPSLGQALLTLTKEVWVLTDRLYVMEAVLADRGIDIREDVQRFQPDEALQAELRAEGTALIERVLGALAQP